MKQPRIALLVMTIVLGSGLLWSEEAIPSVETPFVPILKVLELVTAHHIDPPAPQQFALKIAQNYLAMTGHEPQPNLVQKTWGLSSPEKIVDFLGDLEKAYPDQSKRSRELVWEQVFKSIPLFLPDTMIRRTRDARIEESFSSNRYVGIGIVLALQDGYPAMMQIMEGGAAEKAGAAKGDLIYSIDGLSTRGWDLQKTIDQLRGQQGSKLILELGRDPRNPRRCTLVRDVVPFKTVTLEKGEPGYGVVVLTDLRSSTVSELRKLESDLLDRKGIILDLRQVRGGRVHDAVLLANALMDGGAIGRVRTVDGIRLFEAEPERLFGDVPLAILVSNHSDLSAWIAFAAHREKQAATVFSGHFTKLIATRYYEIPGTEFSITFPYCLLEGPQGPERTIRSVGQKIGRAELPLEIHPSSGKDPNLTIGPESTAPQRAYELLRRAK